MFKQHAMMTPAGLATYPNNLSAVPPGALLLADNVVIDREGVIESRRGQTQYGSISSGVNFSALPGPPNRLFNYDNSLITQYTDPVNGGTLAYDSTGAITGSGLWVDYAGSYGPPTGAQMRSLQANGSFYFTTSSGVMKIDALNHNPIAAGVPGGLDGFATLSGTSGWLSTATAYRMVFGYTDANDVENLGAPSQRIVVSNTPENVNISSVSNLYNLTVQSGTWFSANDTVTQGSISDTVTNVVSNTITMTTEGNLWSAGPVQLSHPVTIQTVNSGANTLTLLTGQGSKVTGNMVVSQTNSSGSSSSGSTNLSVINVVGDTLTMTTSTAGYAPGKANVISNQAITAYNPYLITVGGSPTIPTLSTLTQNGNTATVSGVAGANVTLYTVEPWTTGAATISYPVDTVVNATVPPGVQAGWFYQAYRTIPQAPTYNSTPTDDMQLVYQTTITSTDITNGYVQFNDITPDSLAGADLYTDPNEGGILNSYNQPPLCLDMDYYQGVAFYANVTLPQSLEFNLIATGSPGGLQVGDTITVNGVTFTGASVQPANPVVTPQFGVVTNSTPAQNVQLTAANLVQTINRYKGAQGVVAYYLATDTSNPGLINLVATNVSAPAFTVTTNRSVAFSPTLAGAAATSTGQSLPNYVYYSLPNQPEAVPSLNSLQVGSSNYPIRRIVALRDAVYVFKDDGIYDITGTSAPWTVAAFDNTAYIVAPEAAVKLDNQVFLMSTQGVITVSSTGTSLMSRPIEDILKQLSAFPNFAANTFAVPYEADRKYILFTVSTDADTFPTQAYVYNYITNTWTHWVFSNLALSTSGRSCGIVNQGDKFLYLGNPVNDYIYQERKTYTQTDYADEQYPTTITGYTGNQVTVSTTTGIAVGMSLFQNLAVNSVITAINGNILTVEDNLQWTLGPAYAMTPISNSVLFVPTACGNEGLMKQFSKINFTFLNTNFDEIDVNITSDMNLATTTIALPSNKVGGWGQFPWGGLPWGVYGGSGQQVLPTLVPKGITRGHWLNIQLSLTACFSSFSLMGYEVWYNENSERSTR